MVGEAGVDVVGEGPRAALCAALSAAERGCTAAGIAAGEALDLLRAARSAAERPGAAAPQVWAATDVPQPDCGPGPADICVVVVRGVTTGRGCITAGVRTRRSSMTQASRSRAVSSSRKVLEVVRGSTWKTSQPCNELAASHLR